MRVRARPRSPDQSPRALRRQGQIPAVVYGPHVESLPISIPEDELVDLLRHGTRSTMVEVEVDGEVHHVFLKDVQVDPVTDRLWHVDLYVPEPGRPLVMPVSVRLLGTAPGVREGGLLEHVHEYIEVEAIPKLIPPEIEVDVSQLGIGDSVLVGDLPWEEGVRPLLPPGDVVVTVLAPRVLVVAEAEEEALATPVEEEPPG